MIIGTAFMLYQNYRLTSPNQAGTSLLNDNFFQSGDQAGQTAAIKKSGGFDLTIFSSEKFKQLKENALIGRPQPELGKRDPFKPN